jgi:SAM-dependent MidA family methyltransferase
MPQLFNIIRQKIKENNGAICFRDFMRTCLYEPKYGYYAGCGRVLGRKGDYYTSVSVGELFGDLLACEFLRWFNNEKKDNRINYLLLIEAGAHDGSLASDILNRISNESGREIHDKFFKYVIVEPSEELMRIQKEKLKVWRDNVLWIRDFESACQNDAGEILSLRSAYTIIFSNELLDAFPCHRLIWLKNKNAWMEIGVCSDGDDFKWTIIKPCAECEEFISELDSGYADILKKLNGDFIVEYPSDAIGWWRSACKFLKKGRIVVFDYGFAGYGLLNPEKPNGTLRGYHKHHVADSVLQNPGNQDITSDVNFDLFIREAELLGLEKVFYGTQSSFLTAVVKENNITTEKPWFSKSVNQFMTLIHPDYLGFVIKVLVMEKK